MTTCPDITQTLACFLYEKNLFTLKISYLIIIFGFSLFMIYYSKTKQYRELVKRYPSFRLMLMYPIGISYFIWGTIFFMPLFLSNTVDKQTFMNFVWAVIIPIISWVLIFIFGLIFDWIFRGMGFNGGKAFVKAVFKK